MPIVLSRRELLKLGLGTSLAVSAIGVTASLAGCSSDRPATGFAVLRDGDLAPLAALLPIMVGPHPALQQEQGAIEAALHQLDRSLASMSPAIQKEVRELLDLLNLPLTRGPLTGVWGAWEKASPEDIDAFLVRWRDSRLDLLRQGYKALNQLLLMAWYALPMAWAETGYPGPPRI
ncbi:hypothetical protein SAMN02745148_01212 [Modicisalibacter ilicicola DSM 19980]|uniref:Twin-arginine translocation pathway signal protein n=1 Tax=Modicisalibacter ilicicola DSM 19980 TaxID=1121942 RepID=A0A1M4WIH7_9GAMM|nr:twin-arginine translocation pathway signal protein [Halomonas ilicicola]SHE80863.1 hypothetical protein SAMN02745148_01212 [Halomonas ilicicola DSM 19980]